jgi:lipopolysaccharide/colanic/teichoic acid biosynthesis glycosyltransferase
MQKNLLDKIKDENKITGSMRKVKNDTSITRIRKFLRKISIHELI